MSQLHMVSEADRQNHPCSVCVVLGVLCESRGCCAQSLPQDMSEKKPGSVPPTHTHAAPPQLGARGGDEDGPENIRGAQGGHL